MARACRCETRAALCSASCLKFLRFCPSFRRRCRHISIWLFPSRTRRSTKRNLSVHRNRNASAATREIDCVGGEPDWVVARERRSIMAAARARRYNIAQDSARARDRQNININCSSVPISLRDLLIAAVYS